jgi:hypothetical protein
LIDPPLVNPHLARPEDAIDVALRHAFEAIKQEVVDTLASVVVVNGDLFNLRGVSRSATEQGRFCGQWHLRYTNISLIYKQVFRLSHYGRCKVSPIAVVTFPKSCKEITVLSGLIRFPRSF